MTLDYDYLSPDVVAAHVVDRLPSLGAVSRVDRLHGGHLNLVWRAVATRQSVIVKVMAPFAASDPSLYLDPGRVAVEASALEILSPGGALGSISGENVRVPGLLDHDRDRGILILEDVGTLPDLAMWIESNTEPDSAFDIGSMIGCFIGHLHRESTGVPGIASRVANPQIQQTRLDTQYLAVEELARTAGIADAEQLGRSAVAFGRELLRPGCVFIMGDLWPRSLLLSGHRVTVIDWELAHWGRPAQDVGHLAAHLWMLEHRAVNGRLEAAYNEARAGFLTAYHEAMGSRFEELFGALGLEQARIHAGAEIFVRTMGRFAGGYVYDGLDANDPLVREAADIAASLIRGKPEIDLFAHLDR